VITFTIDGREVSVDEGATVLDAARREGIPIPTLCSYEPVEPFGGCRLCLVEVEGIRRLQAACTLLPTGGMTLSTNNDRIADARRDVLELLLINHPLDCGFCDKAGECELQQMVLEYGPPVGRYQEPKRRTPINLGDDMFTLVMDRCIACARCVRVCEEVQGVSAITMVDRGEATKVAPFTLDEFACEYCGNCVPACPVGAILPNPQLHSFRRWQVEREADTVCGECGVGCSLTVQTRLGSIARVSSRVDQGINRGQLCARGRYGYQYVGGNDRLSSPLIRRDGQLVECGWDEAISFAADRLTEIRQRHGGSSIAGIASPRCTNEDNYVFQRFLRTACGSNNIDSISRMGFVAAQQVFEGLLGFGATANRISDISNSQAVLVVGGDPTAINPILGLAVRQASRRGGAVGVIGRAAGLERQRTVEVATGSLVETALLESLVRELVGSRSMISGAAGIASAIADMRTLSASESPPDGFHELVDLLRSSEDTSIVVGPELVQRGDGYRALTAVAGLVFLLDARLYVLAEGPNDQGVADMGCVPDRLSGCVPWNDHVHRRRIEEAWGGPVPRDPGLTLMEMVEAVPDSLRALYVMGENPAVKLPAAAAARDALEALDLLVVQDIFLTETARLADLVLPAHAWSERDGTYTNIEGRLQVLRRAVVSDRGRPDWQIICEIGSRMGESMDYPSSSAILDEISLLSPLHSELDRGELERSGWMATRHGEPCYREMELWEPADQTTDDGRLYLGIDRQLAFGGTTSRRCDILRQVGPPLEVTIGPAVAQRFGIQKGDRVRLTTKLGSVTAPARIDPSVFQDRVLFGSDCDHAGVFGLLEYTLDPVTKAPGVESCEVTLEKEEES
jgi:predicted molibdopterin-dependent oxidoreductase YjgC